MLRTCCTNARNAEHILGALHVLTMFNAYLELQYSLSKRPEKRKEKKKRKGWFLELPRPMAGS